MSPFMEFKEVIDLVVGAAQIASTKNLVEKVRFKGVADFVTEADMQINSFLKNGLKILDKSIGFFSEEEIGKLTDPCWILDPIDGTTNLHFGYKMSAISLALYANGDIQFGVVYDLFNRELFAAKKGEGSYLDGKRLNVSTRNIENSLIEFGVVSADKENVNSEFELAQKIFLDCLDIRRTCSAALNLCYIAAKRLDGYFSRKIEPWDIAAGTLILTEAGGKISTYDRKNINYSTSNAIIATNGSIHHYMQNIISPT